MSPCPFGVGDTVIIGGVAGVVIGTSTVGGETMLQVRLPNGSVVVVPCSQFGGTVAARSMRRSAPRKGKAKKKRAKKKAKRSRG